jgi:hypothetical protein
MQETTLQLENQKKMKVTVFGNHVDNQNGVQIYWSFYQLIGWKYEPWCDPILDVVLGAFNKFTVWVVFPNLFTPVTEHQLTFSVKM